MSPQFNPPERRNNKTREESLLEPIQAAIQTLPSLYAQYKANRMKEDLTLEELKMKRKEFESKYGTGVNESVTAPGQLLSAPPPEAGDFEQLHGFEATMPTMTEETEEQKLRRLGSDNYKTLKPQQYGSYVLGDDGKPQFLALPEGYKPSAGVPMPTPILTPEGKQVGTTVGKPTVLPKPDVSSTKDDAAANEMESIVSSAIEELTRIEPLNDKSRGGFFGRLAQRAESSVDPDKPSEEFNNTADVINTLQGMVSRVLKSTFGGQLSDSERQYLNEIYGASEKMSRKERSIAIKNVKKMLSDKLAASRSKAGQTSPAAEDSDPLGLR